MSGAIKNPWLGLASLMPALAMSFLDQSVLPVALPTIQKDLHATDNELIWSVNAYLLVTAVLVLAGGKMSDRIGHRRSFCWGLMTFGIASILCALSMSGLWLILARALQGLGAAFMFPASTALLMSFFSPKDRGKATGINVSFGSIFLIVGPLVGGYLTESFSWRWIFWLNIPLTLLGLLMTCLFIPKSKKGEGKLDSQGFCYFVGSCTMLVMILMQGREWGWTSPKILLLCLGFVISSILLILREKKAAHPFLDLTLFKNPIFKGVNLSIFATQFVLMITVFWAIFFQEVLYWSPMNAGFVIFLCSVPVLFVAPLAGLLLDRLGPKFPLSIGFILLISALIWIAAFMTSSFGILLPGLLAFGVGISFILTPSYATAMSAIPKNKAGIAFGAIQTTRSLSSTLGVATIGSFMDHFKSSNALSYIQVALAVLLIFVFSTIIYLFNISEEDKTEEVEDSV